MYSVSSKNVASNITIVSDLYSSQIQAISIVFLYFQKNHYRKLHFWIKLKTPRDFLCHEVFKNVYFVGVRNIEGENHPGHTVDNIIGADNRFSSHKKWT